MQPLSVDRSLLNTRWVLKDHDSVVASRLIQVHGLPEIVARLLSARGVGEDQFDTYLNPTLLRDFPDPFKLFGMGALSYRLAEIVEQKSGLGIFGDFDVDGATSTSLMVRVFRHLGLDVAFHIPDRVSEGYGPNLAALLRLQSLGCKTVILVDCGISAVDVITQACNAGLEVIVLDHHEPGDILPPAQHIINPKLAADESGYHMMAAVGVAFMTMVALNTTLRKRGFYQAGKATEPVLKSYMDLVALGTVCDMVPLTGPNRLFVKNGLSYLNQKVNPGIQALADISNLKDAVTVENLGFAIGPRINAGSRVHLPDLGVKILSTDDRQEAQALAITLDQCNTKRRQMEQETVRAAATLVEAHGYHNHPVIIVDHPDWHPGLAGLVAGRLKEKYGRPAIVVTYATGVNGAREGRGSGRSIPGVNIAASFLAAMDKGLLIKGGGHAMAGGFTIDPVNLAAFRTFLHEHISIQMIDAPSLSPFEIDAVASVRGLNIAAARIIENHLGPFGIANAEPVFALPSVRIWNASIVGENHVRCMVSDWEGGARAKAIAFRCVGTPLGEILLKSTVGAARPLHLAGRVKVDRWNGTESPSFLIEDAALATAQVTDAA